MILAAFCLTWLICAFSLILGHARFADRFALRPMTQTGSGRQSAPGQPSGASVSTRTLATSGVVLAAVSIEHRNAPVFASKSINRLASAQTLAGASFSDTGLFLAYPAGDVAVPSCNPGDAPENGIIFRPTAAHMETAILTVGILQPANLVLLDVASAGWGAGRQQVAA